MSTVLEKPERVIFPPTFNSGQNEQVISHLDKLIDLNLYSIFDKFLEVSSESMFGLTKFSDILSSMFAQTPSAKFPSPILSDAETKGDEIF